MNIHACKCISQFISLLILYFVDRSIAPTSWRQLHVHGHQRPFRCRPLRRQRFVCLIVSPCSQGQFQGLSADLVARKTPDKLSQFDSSKLSPIAWCFCLLTNGVVILLGAYRPVWNVRVSWAHKYTQIKCIWMCSHDHRIHVDSRHASVCRPNRQTIQKRKSDSRIFKFPISHAWLDNGVTLTQ